MRTRFAPAAGAARAGLAASFALAALAALAVLLAGAAAGCRSLPPDQIARSAGDEESAAQEAFALRLLELRLAADAVRLAELRAELEQAAARPGQSRLAQARVGALRAEAAWQAGERSAARSLAEAAAKLSDTVEGNWLVLAELEADAARRLAILETGLARADKRSRLLCERGRELLKAGRYAEAAQDLDEGLRDLDLAYRALYGADRERALSLAQAAREAGNAAAIGPPDALEGPLTMRTMVERAFRQTRLLSSLSANPSPTYAAALPSLRSAGLLLGPAAGPDAPAPRRTVAFFLWGLVARTERDPSLLTRYRQRYSFSPVPDVAVEEPWFDAVLGVVEREIMDLPDGVNFRPDGEVSGLEYLSILQRLQRLYR